MFSSGAGVSQAGSRSATRELWSMAGEILKQIVELSKEINLLGVESGLQAWKGGHRNRNTQFVSRTLMRTQQPTLIHFKALL